MDTRNYNVFDDFIFLGLNNKEFTEGAEVVADKSNQLLQDLDRLKLSQSINKSEAIARLEGNSYYIIYRQEIIKGKNAYIGARSLKQVNMM